jgi:hypothetical protein
MGHPVGRGGFRVGVMTARSSFLVQIQNQHSNLRIELRSEKGESDSQLRMAPRRFLARMRRYLGLAFRGKVRCSSTWAAGIVSTTTKAKSTSMTMRM